MHSVQLRARVLVDSTTILEGDIKLKLLLLRAATYVQMNNQLACICRGHMIDSAG